MRVLFADDALVTREQLDGFLTRLGHEVVGQATDGGEAIDLFEREHPDAVLLDMCMLRVDGDVAARAIRARDTKVAMVFVTSQTNRTTDNLALECNASVLKKPIDPHAIHQVELALKKALALVT